MFSRDAAQAMPRAHVIPADHHWYRNLAIGRILCDTLTAMDPQFPPALPPGIKKIKIR